MMSKKDVDMQCRLKQFCNPLSKVMNTMKPFICQNMCEKCSTCIIIDNDLEGFHNSL